MVTFRLNRPFYPPTAMHSNMQHTTSLSVSSNESTTAQSLSTQSEHSTPPSSPGEPISKPDADYLAYLKTAPTPQPAGPPNNHDDSPFPYGTVCGYILML